MEIEVTNLPDDDPKKVRLGWKFTEVPFGKTTTEHNKETMSEEDFNKWIWATHYKRNQKTDVADSYKVRHHKEFELSGSSSFIKIDVLELLWGQPWNNLALRYVSSLRPSCLRVTKDWTTADAHSWRVTVYLEEDDRTIRKIHQEVEVDSSGAINGHDLICQLKHQKEHGDLEEYEYPDIGRFCILNDEIDLNLEIKDD